MTQPFGPYSETAKHVKQAPAWVPPKDQARIASYQIWTETYWSHVDQNYKVMNRGLDQDDDPLYVPSTRIVINTLNRYVGTGLNYALEGGTEQTQLEARAQLDKLFTRERFFSRYAANKRQGLVKGDWCWHLVADPEKPEGTRISILVAQPDNYFVTTEEELQEGGDPDKIMQVRLVELVQVGDETLARVQLYDKWNEGNPDGLIYSSLTTWKQEEWFDPEKAPQATITPPTPLPAVITAFPVYHIPNGGPDLANQPWGTSEMRGHLGLQAALNQSVTDEDLALALIGIGVYATDEPGSPTNAKGEATDWFIYPGAVISNAKGLRRVEGITTLAPYNDHVNRLEGYLADASGATDAARGRLEVSEAESGIALQLKLAPTLAKAAESDQAILDTHNQMFYDLVMMWLPTFEGVNITDVTVKAVLGDKLPINRAAEAELISALHVAGLVSAGSARLYLAKHGFRDLFDPNEGDLMLAEKVALAAAELGDQTLEGRAADELPEGGAPDADA